MAEQATQTKTYRELLVGINCPEYRNGKVDVFRDLVLCSAQTCPYGHTDRASFRYEGDPGWVCPSQGRADTAQIRTNRSGRPRRTDIGHKAPA